MTTTTTTTNEELCGFKFAAPGARTMRQFCRMHVCENRPMSGSYALALRRSFMEQTAANLRARGYRVELVPVAALRGRVVTV